MPYQLVNTRGHYPAGYPRGGGPGGSPPYDPRTLEQATDTLTEDQLQTFKSAVSDATGTSAASDYFNRSSCARDWWYARWPLQTVDGRKWGDPNDPAIQPWPWPGASDTRVRTVERTIGEHRTLHSFATRTWKWQAKSTRPSATIRESQQTTTLLNWMLFSQNQMEMHRESRLAISWRNGYGAAIIDAGWKQTRRLDYIDVSVPGLQEFINEPAVAQFLGGGLGNIPIGENLNILDLQEMIMDPAYADDLAVLLRAVSHDFLTLREGRKKLDDLRQLRTVQIPIPHVFESRPCITALRPMVDCFFPPAAGDLQNVTWYDRVEFVSETTLRDRIETDNYDRAFVEAAIDRRGPTGGFDWQVIANLERANITGASANSMENDIELHHFYTLAQDRGVPIRFCTVFHMDVEIEAKHRPAGYDHGEATLHPMRFELDDRPILSSRGIAEIAYTWEQELKAQYDAQSDRTALSLRPPLMTTYDQVQKMKESMQPGVVFPMRKFDEARFMQLPPWDQVSILVIQSVEKRVRDHFAIFGADVDPDLKKLRQEEMIGDFITEWKPVCQQVKKLMSQLLPEQDIKGVVGLSRFHLTRDQIRHEYDISGTVDLRNIDADWFKEKREAVANLVGLDTMGLTDRAELVHSLAEEISPDFADRIIKNPQAASQHEVQDEQKAIDLIIGSGQDQPLPEGANYQLRLQTLQAKQQSITQNPATMQIIQQNPKIMQVIMNRAQFFQRQLQQQQNAQIGRMQVSETFSKQAPQTAAPMGAGGGY
jgi:hypothetical protein